MLVLTRKTGEKVVIGDNVTLTVVEVKGSQVRLAFDAPIQTRILRGELVGRPGRPGSDQELPDPDLAEKPGEWHDDAPAGLRILLVAAEGGAAEDLAPMLRAAGHQVRIASDARFALQDARREEPDVVLLDGKVPGGDARTVARQLLERAALKKPFCIVVADGEGGPALPSPVDAGVDLHLTMPVNYDFLRKVLRRFQRVIVPAAFNRDEERSNLSGGRLSPALV